MTTTVMYLIFWLGFCLYHVGCGFIANHIHKTWWSGLIGVVFGLFGCLISYFIAIGESTKRTELMQLRILKQLESIDRHQCELLQNIVDNIEDNCSIFEMNIS